MKERARRVKEQAVRHFQTHLLDADDENRISLFVQGMKAANAAILAKIELQPIDWWPYRFLHDQYYKEVELTTLLARTVQWTVNPFVYVDAARINMLLWQKADLARHLVGPFELDRRFFEYLALSHAFMAEIRFLPLFPPSWDYARPFLYALSEIEDENGRQIQVQVRLLKQVECQLADDERQAIVERQRLVVADIFCEFLESLLPRAT